MIDAQGTWSTMMPSGFRDALSTTKAQLRATVPFATKRKASGSPAQKAGVRYEKAIQKVLAAHYRGMHFGVWIEFTNAGVTRFCQPDALRVADGVCTIFEMKVTHTDKAWWQLFYLYQPVVKKLFGLPTRCVEVTKSFDPAVWTPSEAHPTFSLRALDEALRCAKSESIFHVVQVRP